MLNRVSADELIAMMQADRPVAEIVARALREFPALSRIAAELDAVGLRRLGAELAAWLEATIAGKAIPPHARGLWLAVSVAVSADPRAMAVGAPVIELQPHPETARGEEWEILEHWRDARPWEPPIRVYTLQEQVALEELTVVLAAALLRDFARTRPASLMHERSLVLEVRPGSAGESLTVGTVGPDGFSMADAGQNLWGGPS